MIPLTCQSCGYANETTRVFCHQCGVRLERPASEPTVVDQNPLPPKPTPPPTRKPVRKRRAALNTEPKSVSLVASFLKICIFAAIWALFLLALRAPTDLPELAAPNPELSQALQTRYLEAVAPSPFSHQLVITNEELNALLATEISIKQFGFIQLASGQPRPFIILQTQAFILGMAIPILGQQLVFQSEFVLENSSPGNVSLKLVKGQIGQMPISPFMMDKVVRWHHAFATAFSTQLQEIQKAKQVLIGSGNVQIIWPADS